MRNKRQIACITKCYEETDPFKVLVGMLHSLDNDSHDLFCTLCVGETKKHCLSYLVPRARQFTHDLV